MDLVIAGIICSVLALIAKRISFPAIPAYIIVGILLGSSGLGVIRGDEVSRSIAEIGVIFLLFYIGLHINPKEISEKRRTIVSAGIYDFVVNFSLTFIFAMLAGFSFQQSFLLASAIYISSSAIVIQSLIENRKLIMREAETVVWIMVFEDIVIAILIILNSLDPSTLLLFAVKLSVFTAAIYILSNYTPKYAAGVFSRDDEVPALLAFSLAMLGLAFEEFFHIPAAYAALMLGMMLSGIRRVEEIILPFKDVFLILFFFFFGVTAEISGEAVTLGIILSALAIVGKVTSGIITGMRVFGSWKSGIEIGIDTIARGEFSVFLAFAFGDERIVSAITTAVLITSVTGAIMSKHSFAIAEKLEKIVERRGQ
ncbi:Kef-type K+ transport system, membrane component [Geoglobus ahangari]|uniref:Kef-type K+ transport system, membrane component n=1 Tax=Geoglobus ahangari TaxID=113653 RepID=A0A0F7IG14_9EURY|nr:cation:proton antiporter [Geoglobus ahangari]AKG91798.1 Kef-type K+ transport system, membrane component [Geoglobus ahangari]